jgi:hypothetical protein
VCSAIFWAWSAIKQKLWANRRKSRDDEKPRHGSGRRGSYRFLVPRLHVSDTGFGEPEIDSPGFASNARGPLTLRCWAGTRAAKSLSNVQEGGSDSDGVCLVRSRRNNPFFCDLEALVPSHPIRCIVEKTGAVLHCIKCT